ncbi:hypothetical protein DV711_15265 [Motiliproteus coralliicola]|uniref:Uncharacterized protein n=1 Tax=Motiliproteus coralliicola TaxID=2283196 RepID=A0A369WEC2_9GAMM|nr:hypothetical protein DV711_15265 [Motiliproteus coralliicola]
MPQGMGFFIGWPGHEAKRRVHKPSLLPAKAQDVGARDDGPDQRKGRAQSKKIERATPPA